MESSQVCAGLEITELRLGLPGSDSIETNPVVGKKRSFADTSDRRHEAEDAGSSTRDGNDSNQTPVVGWPPIRSYRKNHLKKAKADEKEMRSEVGLYVKVSMDGAPFLRKIQLKAYKGYDPISLAYCQQCSPICRLLAMDARIRNISRFMKTRTMIGCLWETFLGRCLSSHAKG